PDLSWIPDYVRQYGADRWNAAKIASRIQTAVDWAEHFGVQLYVGEFGVYRDRGVKPADRAAWLRDVRTALEAQGIGWAVWAYDDNFGIASRGPAVSVGGAGAQTPGVPRYDATINAALGLSKVVAAPIDVVPVTQNAKEDIALLFGSSTKNAIQIV